MARIRTIKPEFWSSPDVGDVSRDARLLFIALWNFADDSGRIEYIPGQLRAAAFPWDDDVTTDMITAWAQELVDATLVLPYQRKRRQYLQITGWEHQRIDRPSQPRCPDPDGDNVTLFAPIPGVHSSASSLPEPPDTLPTPSTNPSRDSIARNVGALERRSVGASDRRTGGASARTRATPLPDDWQPNTDHQQLADELGVDCQDQANRMRDWAKAEGKTGKDWDARFRNWLRKAPSLGQHPARASPPNGVPERLTANEQRTQRNQQNRAAAIAEQRTWRDQQKGIPP